MGGDGDVKLVEQALLLRRGLGDASKPDLAAVGGGQGEGRRLMPSGGSPAQVIP